MKNPQIGRSEKRRIDGSVERLLKNFQGFEPPLQTDDILREMKLDLEYYSGTDPSQLREVVHAITVGVKRQLSARSTIGKVIKKLGLKALLFWDDDRILIDRDQHTVKYRWGTGHECGHKLCPWHKDYLLGDSRVELSFGCHQKIEAEANYASGQLLFMQGRFVDELMASPMSLSALHSLKKTFGNSNASTFWRMIEGVPRFGGGGGNH